MPAEIIVGICRFSYLGRSDWSHFRRNKNTGADRLAEIARTLFDEERLAARFLAFETICLPSILAQRDPRFIFLLVSSPQMPEYWRKRLHALCDPHRQIQILWSDAPMLAEALDQPLRELHDLSDGNLWQFRLDDDDAIDAEFMLRLRRNMARMEGIDECVITAARGLHVALYKDQPTRFLEFRQAFWGAGLAIKLKQPGLSIFRYGHFGLRDQFTHFVDHEHHAALILKWESDSVPLNFDRLPAHTRLIDAELFQTHLAAHFPFLAGIDFDILRRDKARMESVSRSPDRAKPGPTKRDQTKRDQTKRDQTKLVANPITLTNPSEQADKAEPPQVDRAQEAPKRRAGQRNHSQHPAEKAGKARHRDKQKARQSESLSEDRKTMRSSRKDKPENQARARKRNQNERNQKERGQNAARNQGGKNRPGGQDATGKRPKRSE